MRQGGVGGVSGKHSEGGGEEEMREEERVGEEEGRGEGEEEGGGREEEEGGGKREKEEEKRREDVEVWGGELCDVIWRWGRDPLTPVLLCHLQQTAISQNTTSQSAYNGHSIGTHTTIYTQPFTHNRHTHTLTQHC